MFYYRPIPLRLWILIIGCILAVGVTGFMLIEGYSFLDALYMVVITITTIGYYEVRPLSAAGKVFNIVLILSSFTMFTYSLARLTQYVASGEMGAYFKKRNLMKALAQLEQHVVICGFGRNGQQAARTLRAHKVPFLVIEKSAEALQDGISEDPHLLYLQDDAIEDDVLELAGVRRARALLITLPSDADNVFIVLSARSLNNGLQIISRASNPGAAPKLYKAGANNVIMPDLIGGTHMATLVSKPDVLEFIDFLSGEDGEAIHIESVGYDKLPAPIRDHTLREIMAWKRTGVNCIGIKDEDGRFIINPPDTTVISPGMKVIVLGTMEQIVQMKENVG
ncbi:MAG: potassium channel protein [Chitinophagaceae bacterium]|nr:MAG: potassium channel protein [Chitinophagaceae bacterium]